MQEKTKKVNPLVNLKTVYTDNTKSKVVPPVLNMVLKYSSNLRLICLTATPIYDKPQNIISIVNYFLINDKRQTLK